MFVSEGNISAQPSPAQHLHSLYHDMHGTAQSHPAQHGGMGLHPACGLGVPTPHTVTTRLSPKPCYMPVARVSASWLGTKTALGLASHGQGSVPHG